MSMKKTLLKLSHENNIRSESYSQSWTSITETIIERYCMLGKLLVFCIRQWWLDHRGRAQTFTYINHLTNANLHKDLIPNSIHMFKFPLLSDQWFEKELIRASVLLICSPFQVTVQCAKCPTCLPLQWPTMSYDWAATLGQCKTTQWPPIAYFIAKNLNKI